MSIYEIITAVILFSTLLVVGLLSRRQVNILQGDFKARMRPYLGFSEITREEKVAASTIEFKVFVRNFGSLPAKDAKLYNRFAIGKNIEKEWEACPTQGSVFPSHEAMWRIGRENVDESAILSGATKLRLHLKIEYFGASEEIYFTTTDRTHDAFRDDWLDEEGNWK